MKKLFFFLLLSSCITVMSCNKDDEPDNFVTAQIDGADFEATNIIALGDDTLGELVIFISGRNADQVGIGLNIPASTTLGVVNEITSNDFAITFTDENDNAFFTEGQLVLEEYSADDKTMEGTFSFTATQDDDDSNVIQITNGEFKIKYL